MAAKRSYIMVMLFRSGETGWDREGRLHGWTDLPLSEAGRAAVNTDAARVAGTGPATVYHPGDESATETARALASATSARRKQVDELADPNLGLYEGMLLRQMAERHPRRYRQWEEEPLALVPPEGEPIAEARARIFRAAARVLKRTRAEEVAIVLHPIGFGLLRCWLADRPVDDLGSMVEDPTRVERYAVARSHLDRLRDVVAGIDGRAAAGPA